MVGGTKFHREILKASLGCMSKGKSNTKTFHERKSQNLSPVHVSLDNADTVIEGAPLLALFEKWPPDSPHCVNSSFHRCVEPS